MSSSTYPSPFKTPSVPLETTIASFSPSSDEYAVLNVVKRLMDSLTGKDFHEATSLMQPGCSAVNLRDGRIIIATLEGLLDRVFGMLKDRNMSELCFDCEIRVWADLAMVWAPFKTYDEGVERTYGVNIITVAKTEGEWHITCIADSSTVTAKSA
jgi:hypothetical protein